MRRPIAITLAVVTGLLVVFTAYVWVGNWFTARDATGSSILGRGSCLSNGERFNYVVEVAISAASNSVARAPRVEMTAESLKVRKPPPFPGAAQTRTDDTPCVIRKADWPGTARFSMDRPLEGTALTPRGQTVRIRDYDAAHWQIWASRGSFPIEVRWN